MRTRVLYLLILIVPILVVSVVAFYIASETDLSPEVEEVSPDDDPFKGSLDAPVTIIEFSDYQCPYCRGAESVVDQVLEAYGDRVRLVFRDFPLSTIHLNARLAAEASECADDQGRFWDYHDLLFERQSQWAQRLEPNSTFKDYADELGLDVEAFGTCLDTGIHRQEVVEDYEDGIRFGVYSTPTFFINGRKITGASFEVFQYWIEELSSG